MQTHEEKILLKYLIQNKKITRQVAMELLKLQKSQTFEILNALVEKNILQRQGQGRGTYYQLKPN